MPILILVLRRADPRCRGVADEMTCEPVPPKTKVQYSTLVVRRCQAIALPVAESGIHAESPMQQAFEYVRSAKGGAWSQRDLAQSQIKRCRDDWILAPITPIFIRSLIGN
jgi:hypothetical protein